MWTSHIASSGYLEAQGIIRNSFLTHMFHSKICYFKNKAASGIFEARKRFLFFDIKYYFCFSDIANKKRAAPERVAPRGVLPPLFLAVPLDSSRQDPVGRARRRLQQDAEAVVVRSDVPIARPNTDNGRRLVEPVDAVLTGDNTEHPKAFHVVDSDDDVLSTAVSLGDASCVIMLGNVAEKGRSLAPEARFQEVFGGRRRRCVLPKTSGIASSTPNADLGVVRVRHSLLLSTVAFYSDNAASIPFGNGVQWPTTIGFSYTKMSVLHRLKKAPKILK